MVGRVTEEEKWRLLGSGGPALRAVARRRELRDGAHGGVRLGHPGRWPRTSPATATWSATAWTACWCPPGDPVELGEALRALASDPARRERMAEAARERAERFAWPRVAAEVTEVYEQALARAAPRDRHGPRGAARRAHARRARPARAGRSGCPRSSPRTRRSGAARRCGWRGAAVIAAGAAGRRRAHRARARAARASSRSAARCSPPRRSGCSWRSC